VPERTDKRGRIGWLVLFALAGMLPGGDAFGHVVNVFAVVEGKTIRGEVYFRGGVAAQGAKVEAFDPQGRKLAEAMTDQEGKFSFPVRFRCDHRLLAQAGEGHAGQYTVEAAELPEGLPLPEGEADTPGQEPAPPAASPARSDPAAGLPGDARLKELIEAAVNQQVVPLRRQLDRFENTLRVRDVLGGIGYIFGIMGLLFFFLGKRNKGRGGK
jgi:nickel transport protein